MTDTNIYQDIAVRTNGAFMLGVVGPVRTGKSTFIKRFMEALIIPRIDNTYTRERTKDELPQSGSGRTIMTAEPKFVPEDAVSITLGEGCELSVRLVDCVGYMVDGASGQYEDGMERMVTTPWFDHEIGMTEAAEKGTYKVINEHSTIGIVVSCDGSICDIPREKYVQPEARVISELKAIGKPFIMLLNSTAPQEEYTQSLAKELSELYEVNCIPVNCLKMDERELVHIIESILEEFPLKSMGFFLPEWVDALPPDDPLKTALYQSIYDACDGAEKIRDSRTVMDKLEKQDNISGLNIEKSDLGCGHISLKLNLPRALYYKKISEQTGLDVQNDGDLITTLAEISAIKSDYDKLRAALLDVRSKGYGVVMPDSEQMQLEEPKIVRQGGKYTVRLKANAPAIHMIMTNIETEVTPALGGETASEDIINFLLQGFDGDVNRIWQSNIFGKSLYDIAEEGLNSKIEALPENAKLKLQDTLQRIINEGSGGLICILL